MHPLACNHVIDTTTNSVDKKFIHSFIPVKTATNICELRENGQKSQPNIKIPVLGGIALNPRHRKNVKNNPIKLDAKQETYLLHMKTAQSAYNVNLRTKL